MLQHAYVRKSLIGTYGLNICRRHICMILRSSRLSITQNAAGNLHQGIAIIIHVIVRYTQVIDCIQTKVCGLIHMCWCIAEPLIKIPGNCTLGAAYAPEELC